MKVAHAEQHVISTQGMEQKQMFKINTSAHAFAILSSGLYSDKVAAVLREIGCNAHDAHIAAGVPHKPFVVKLPNRIDPQFYIRDFGPGLGHDEVMNLYTTYFASTKQTSNDFTGAFGLGSKSPFSYTDSFVVESQHGGKRRVYSAHIDNTGAPNIGLMSTTDCEASDTGITISFPVKERDFDEFRNRAQEIYQYFVTTPTILGGEPIRPITYEKDMGDWAIASGRSALSVVMGNVRYPLVVSSLNITDNKSDIDKNIRYLSGVVLRFKIGEVQVAASREQLQYDPAGQKHMLSVLRKVVVEAILELERAWILTGGSNTWADKCEFYKLKNSLNKSFSLSVDLLQEVGVAEPKKMYEAIYAWGETLPSAGNNAMVVGLEWDGSKVRRTKMGSAVSFGDYTLSLVYGDDSHAENRIRIALMNGTIEGRVLLVRPVKSTGGTLADMDELLTKVRERFQGIPELKLSDFPAPLTAAGTVRKKLKKGQLPPLPPELEILPPEQRVFAHRQNKSVGWGRRNVPKCYDDNGEELGYDVYENVKEIATSLTLSHGFKFASPTYMTKGDIKRYRMRQRPDWKSYTQHMTEALSSEDNIKILESVFGSFEYRVSDYRYRSNEVDLLGNLVGMKSQHEDAFNTVAPILKKFDLLDTIEKVYQSSIKPAKVDPGNVLACYTKIGDLLKISITPPEFKKSAIAINSKFTTASRIPYSVFINIFEYAPEYFPTFVTSLLED